MNMMKKLGNVICIAAVALAAIACGKNNGGNGGGGGTAQPDENGLVSIKLRIEGGTDYASEINVEMEDGATVQLEYVKDPVDADVTLSWESGDTKVVRVTRNGTLVARGLGSTDVTVKVNDKVYATAHVTVAVPAVRFFALEEDEVTMEWGEIIEVYASEFEPEDAVKTLRWSSSNPDVFSVEGGVDGDGDPYCEITGLKPGTGTLTAIAEGGFKVEMPVTITKQKLGSQYWAFTNAKVGLDNYYDCYFISEEENEIYLYAPVETRVFLTDKDGEKIEGSGYNVKVAAENWVSASVSTENQCIVLHALGDGTYINEGQSVVELTYEDDLYHAVAYRPMTKYLGYIDILDGLTIVNIASGKDMLPSAGSLKANGTYRIQLARYGSTSAELINKNRGIYTPATDGDWFRWKLDGGTDSDIKTQWAELSQEYGYFNQLKCLKVNSGANVLRVYSTYSGKQLSTYFMISQ